MFSAGIISYSSGGITLTVDHTKVGASLTDFPVYVNLNDVKSGITLTEAQSIRIYNSSMTELARDIVTKDKMTFKADSLSSSVDTVFNIVMDGVSGDYAVTATYGRNNVYTGYKAYYDFASGNSNDRTGNGYNGSDSNVSYSGDYASFNGTNSIISNASYDTKSYIAIGNNIATNKLCSYLNDATGWNQGSNTISTNTFQQLGFTYNGSTVSHIENGSITDTFSRSGGGSRTIVFYVYPTRVGADSYLLDNDNANINIGYRAGSGAYQGRMYLAYIALSALSSSRIATEYNNQSSPSTFYTIS